MALPLRVAYTDEYLEWQLGEGHPTNPVRAQIAVRLLEELAKKDRLTGGIDFCCPSLGYRGGERYSKTLGHLMEVHEPKYVSSVMAGHSNDWAGTRPRLGEIAATMFRGTVDLVTWMAWDGFKPAVYFNPQGAKHHAQRAHSSGFCVFNDMAWAAKHLRGQGKRVAYLDWDAHHGDGVENLCRDDAEILTISIHQYGGGFYPGTGAEDEPLNAVRNFPLSRGAGDKELLYSMSRARESIRRFKPDVILLACGADGLDVDPLSGLRYTHEGLFTAAKGLGNTAAMLGVPVLIGGAGGYRPLDHTPRSWATTVAAIQHVVATAARVPAARA